MRVELDDEHRALEHTLREFCKKEVRPFAGEWERSGEIPKEIVGKLGSLGLMGVCIPEEYGGVGMNTISYAIAIKEIASADGSLALMLASHNSLCAGHILLSGTEAQKSQYLPLLSSGEKLGAWCLTEPGSGSDAAAMKSKAERAPGGWKINGTKMFITQGSSADIYILLAVTDRDKGKGGITAFIAERDNRGLNPGKKLDKLGMRASDTAEVVFEEMFLPDDKVLGKAGGGFFDTLNVLSGGRISIAALAVGIAAGAVRESVKYARERQQFGKPISNFQAVQWMIADISTEIEAAWMLTLKAAYLKDAGKKYTKEASMAKLYASETAMKATVKAVQIHGGASGIGTLGIQIAKVMGGEVYTTAGTDEKCQALVRGQPL